MNDSNLCDHISATQDSNGKNVILAGDFNTHGANWSITSRDTAKERALQEEIEMLGSIETQRRPRNNGDHSDELEHTENPHYWYRPGSLGKLESYAGRLGETQEQGKKGHLGYPPALYQKQAAQRAEQKMVVSPIDSSEKRDQEVGQKMQYPLQKETAQRKQTQATKIYQGSESRLLTSLCRICKAHNFNINKSTDNISYPPLTTKHPIYRGYEDDTHKDESQDLVIITKSGNDSTRHNRWSPTSLLNTMSKWEEKVVARELKGNGILIYPAYSGSRRGIYPMEVIQREHMDSMNKDTGLTIWILNNIEGAFNTVKMKKAILVKGKGEELLQANEIIKNQLTLSHFTLFKNKRAMITFDGKKKDKGKYLGITFAANGRLQDHAFNRIRL
ncbi:hypothetical protein DFH27DRAFT_529246 [Peziza echinospora]|nr:hypothetical protein DFH27DRAFT_529246 [Peziza echinospora]